MQSRSLLLISILLLLFIALGIGYYKYNAGESSDTALQKLADQNIDATDANFFAEIKAGHTENVKTFLMAGEKPEAVDENGVSALMQAVESGNKDSVMALLSALPANPQQSGAIINLQDKSGRSALSIAVETNAIDIVTELLNHGADTSVANGASQTPIALAVLHKYNNLLPLLIDADRKQHQGANINSADMHGETPLTDAIHLQNSEMVQLLLAAKADAVSADRSGITPLMIAAETGNEAIGAQLLAAGAKIDIADKSGNSPLSIAIRHGNAGFVRLLLDKGADPDFHTTGPLPLQTAIASDPFNADIFASLMARSKQAGNIDPQSLFDAIAHKNAPLVKTLLDHGVNTQGVNAEGESLAYAAIANGLEDAALALIDKGSDYTKSGTSGISALEQATRNNEIKVVQKLLELGVSPDKKTSQGYSVAEMSVYGGHPEILDALLAKGARLEKDFSILWSIRDGGGKAVPVLLKYGAHPDVMNNTGDSALLLAASAGETDAVAALIAYHAAINYPNANQLMTPLAAASHNGQLAVVKLLVGAGAKLDLPDANGMTPLAHAVYMTKPDVAEYLIAKGADIHATDKQGRSLMDLSGLSAMSEGRDKIQLLLQQHKP